MMFTTKNLIALPLLHFSQNSIAIFQYFNKLESYWNIAIYCNNSINCNLLQYRSIKRRSVRDIDFNLYKNSAINIVCTTCVRLYKVRANNMNHNYQHWRHLLMCTACTCTGYFFSLEVLKVSKVSFFMIKKSRGTG